MRKSDWPVTLDQRMAQPCKEVASHRHGEQDKPALREKGKSCDQDN
jgi:hypothetical protein